MNSFNKERNACFGVAFLLMFMIGIYFVHIPWNIERLQIDESDLGFAILSFGVSFLISNQIAGRILVPKFGTKLVMRLAFPIVAFSTFLSILVYKNNSTIILYLIIVNSTSDISAYIFGNFFKGPKIFPKISPNKTFSGSLSAVFCSIIISVYLQLSDVIFFF